MELEKVFEVSGQIVNELWCLTTENWMSFIQRPTNQADSYEVEWLVGPIPKVHSISIIVAFLDYKWQIKI